MKKKNNFDLFKKNNFVFVTEEKGFFVQEFKEEKFVFCICC